MHLRVIIPIADYQHPEEALADAHDWVTPGTVVDVRWLDHGPTSIESEYDDALAAPGVLQRVEEAAADGVDGVFISCFGDPAVHAAREIFDGPVVGGFEPAMLTALSLGENVGILTVLPNVIPTLHALARRATIERRIGTIRSVDIPVLALDDEDLLRERLFEHARDAVTKREADVIVLGCTGMRGVTAELRARLAAAGLHVPVIDPTGAALAWLESCLRLQVTSSRTTYLPPPAKKRVP